MEVFEDDDVIDLVQCFPVRSTFFLVKNQDGGQTPYVVAIWCSCKPNPHYAGGIWKQSFISPVRPSVHTNPEKLPTENGAFRKRSWKRRNLKTELCVLVWTENICLPESSSNTNPKWRPKWWLPCWFRHVGSTKTLLCACSRVHSSVSAACDYCVFKFLRRSVKTFYPFSSVDEKHFRVKHPFSNFSGVVWRGHKPISSRHVQRFF